MLGRRQKRIGLLALGLILGLNLIAFVHAWRFTHFVPSGKGRPVGPIRLSLSEKLGMLFTGIPLSRPAPLAAPQTPHRWVRMGVRQDSVAVLVQEPDSGKPKGTVALFHGYGAGMGQMAERAAFFRSRGYRTMLVDFQGSGSSSGSATSIGYHEAETVKAVYAMARRFDGGNVLLAGLSMGSAAILRAIAVDGLRPDGLVLECPYNHLYTTTAARFTYLGLPPFPMAGVMLFWGGVQMGFWPFEMDPARYARSVQCPTLLMSGGKDPYVSQEATREVFANLGGPKRLHFFPLAAHEDYLVRYRQGWQRETDTFLQKL